MQPKEGQHEEDADSMPPKMTIWRNASLAPDLLLLVSTVMLIYETTWKHRSDTLLSVWDCQMPCTSECSGIPDEKVRQV
jgi:hypothetical protein